MSIYTTLLEAGCELDHHESDLYVRSTARALELIRSAPDLKLCRLESFADQRGAMWIEIPFAYDPFWQAKSRAT